MSVHVTSWVFAHSPESTPGRRLILLVLADKADHDGTGAYPSVATIARETRMSERGVRYGLRALEESGQIRRLGLHPTYGTHEYAVVMGQPVQGGKPAQEGGQSAAAERSQIAPEPSVEPSSTIKRAERARAKADELPQGFPPALAEHARRACEVVRSVAEQHNAREVTLRGVAMTMLSQPHRRYVSVAYELASWAQAPPRPILDATASYRTFLRRAEVCAGVEPLNGEVPLAASAPNVHAMRPRRNGSGGWTPQEMLELGRLEPGA